ncbi:MFS transporter [Acinetobacter halotolerans]|uniref:MFS transporter n=1 Tax=Acinetobacter halotolerans TaxID=1752076 RepID=A0A4Q6XAB7_9GAMM|nr:MFS transporter [Acinetobacter halotolerans]RZF51620.1 MFS transporter [Acinetobacter halotolerans]
MNSQLPAKKVGFIKHSPPDQLAEKLPIWQLLAFSSIGFITIMTETMPVGLLPQISMGLNVSEVWAGQLVSFYALGSVCAAIPIIALTSNWNRRRLLLLTIGALCIFNSISAISTNYIFTLIVRFCAGMAAGVIWGLFVGYVRYLVVPHLQGRALAIAGIGQPLALCLGVPLGTLLGTLFDWRGVFWIMSIFSLLLYVWIRLYIPDFNAHLVKQKTSLKQVFLISGVRSVLLILFIWILAHNILYTYIASYLDIVGLSENTDVILLLFGVSAIFGIWITGCFIDKYLRNLSLISLLIFALAVLSLGVFVHSPWMILVSIILWGISFGGAPILLQTALADVAKEHTDVAQSMLVTIFNFAVAGGGVVGGFLLKWWGVRAFPWSMLILLLLALVLVYQAKDKGFNSNRTI